MINEHDIKDWWLTDELKQLQEEVAAIKASEGSYADIFKDLELIDLKIQSILKDVYDRLGDKRFTFLP